MRRNKKCPDASAIHTRDGAGIMDDMLTTEYDGLSIVGGQRSPLSA
jgi:hypothetical protein